MLKNIKYVNKKSLLILKEEKKTRQKKYNLIFLVIIILISIISFIIIKKLLKKKIRRNEALISTNVEKLLTQYNYNVTIKEELTPYLKYIEYSKNDAPYNKRKSINFEPKISVVIALYNREKEIKYGIRSIQNQNFSDFEIIIVDDFSNDNSSKCIKELKEEDSRIILLQNKQNMGTLYSKSIGVLYAKGKYIHSLDSDDMFCNKNYFSLSYNKAIEGDYDFVNSNGLYINEINKKIIIRQPFWVVLWAKLIKKEIYQNAIYKIGIEILKLKVITLDDDVVAYNLFFSRKSTKINTVGVAHYIHESSHVYFNAFRNHNNSNRFCTNLITTVKAFYMFKNSMGFTYGDFLFNNYFKRGPCNFIFNSDEVQALNRSKNYN